MGTTPVSTLPALGALSERYESNGDPGAIGFDKNGGWSYGTYQLATKPGTFADFMRFLNTAASDVAGRLNDAGGAQGALQGMQTFKDAWKAEAANNKDAFKQVQHDYIKATHYDKAVQMLKDSFSGFDVNQRSRALQNVVWSMAVQHGPGGTRHIFQNALGAGSLDSMTDAQIIPALYAERSKVDVYFASSTAAVKASVLKRYQQEEQQALQMLQAETGNTN